MAGVIPGELWPFRYLHKPDSSLSLRYQNDAIALKVRLKLELIEGLIVVITGKKSKTRTGAKLA